MFLSKIYVRNYLWLVTGIYCGVVQSYYALIFGSKRTWFQVIWTTNLFLKVLYIWLLPFSSFPPISTWQYNHLPKLFFKVFSKELSWFCSLNVHSSLSQKNPPFCQIISDFCEDYAVPSKPIEVFDFYLQEIILTKHTFPSQFSTESSDWCLQACSLTHYCLKSDTTFSEKSCIVLYTEYKQNKLLNKVSIIS